MGATTIDRASHQASPVGQSAEEAAARRKRRSATYREEAARLAPFEELARIVIRFRIERGLTQQELAERIGTSHSAISRLETGQHPTSVRTLERLAEGLGLRLVVGFETAAGDRELVTV
jgi:ribosome-binding protein aMBF1 (putative translation factor)